MNKRKMQQTIFNQNNSFENLIKNKEEEIKKMVEIEMALFKFELAQACIPKKERDKSKKSIKELRGKRWKKSLKLAKGDEKKAEIIYDKI